MIPKNKFWWFAGVSIGLTGLFISILTVFFWRQLTPDEERLLIDLFKHHFAYIFIAIFLLLTGFVFALDGIFHNYIIPVSRLAEEVRVIHSVNPSHRVKTEGSRDISRLAAIINEGAEAFEALRKNIGQKIQAARADSEEEKNLLASFMSELPEGVLICNADGRILFYNKQARNFLGPDGQAGGGDPSSRFIGLGRSIFSVIDENLILHALDEIAEKFARQERNVAAYFAVVAPDGRLLRAETVPILNRDQPDQVGGFILILYDITDSIETERRLDYLLQTLLRRIRASLAGIRSGIEAIVEYPDMAPEKRSHLQRIIHEEALRLGGVANETAAEYERHMRMHWPVVAMPVADLFETIRRKAEEKLKLNLRLKPMKEPCWTKVDSYAIILSVLYVLDHLSRETGHRSFECRFEKKPRYVQIDISWEGRSLSIETLRRWEAQPLLLENEGIGLSLREVMAHHDAQIWCAACEGAEKRPSLRFFLPLVSKDCGPSQPSMRIRPDSRPEFFDFDLFNQPGQTPELDQRPLKELTYTVFDTETTGLSPETDEIISIGAVRIVNGRLLRRESFDQLVDPLREVPYESVKIHGIQPEMLKNKPAIHKVLPLFAKFAEETVLVGHNVAFDMRMFQVKEALAGTRFINPVLDTLLLSAVVHPAQRKHTLESIAERLGIRIIGRHTALGDAICAGEVFLRLLPLLEKAGIRTLREAVAASRKTYYARLKY